MLDKKIVKALTLIQTEKRFVFPKNDVICVEYNSVINNFEKNGYDQPLQNKKVF